MKASGNTSESACAVAGETVDPAGSQPRNWLDRVACNEESTGATDDGAADASSGWLTIPTRTAIESSPAANGPRNRVPRNPLITAEASQVSALKTQKSNFRKSREQNGARVAVRYKLAWKPADQRWGLDA